MTRALVVCPGRGSYNRDCLGSLHGRSPAANAVLDACDAWRVARGQPSVRELDAEPSFSPRKHMAGEHASLLTFAASMADLADLSSTFEVVGVIGNSMGWYTALAAAGALSLEDGIRLVDTMGAYQRDHVIGGQLLYPITRPDWLPDPDRVDLVHAAIEGARAAGGQAGWSINLGSFAVIGADERGLTALKNLLPPETRGAQTFPTQLPLHSAFHTPLLRETSERAQRELADLTFRAPRVPLIDGRGAVFRPLHASPKTLFAYTLGHQVVEPYDYALSLQTALQHTAPDVVVLLGPGNSLGGPTAATMTHVGWRAMALRSDFELAQAQDNVVLAFGVAEQRARLTA